MPPIYCASIDLFIISSRLSVNQKQNILHKNAQFHYFLVAKGVFLAALGFQIRINDRLCIKVTPILVFIFSRLCHLQNESLEFITTIKFWTFIS